MLYIKSRENPTVKHILKTVNSRSYRKDNREFIIEGARLCGDALNSNVEIKKVLCTEKAMQKHGDLINKMNTTAENLAVVTDSIMKVLSDTESSQGILCICNMLDKQFRLDRINNVDKIIALENIQDPSNLGNILRTAEALGIKCVVMTDDCCDVYNPKVLRGSMGAVFRLPVYVTENLPSLVTSLKNDGVDTFAAVPDTNAEKLGQKRFLHPCLVAIGNEGNGLKPETIDVCSHKLTIPMKGLAESLNAATAASIIMWELIRGG